MREDALKQDAPRQAPGRRTTRPADGWSLPLSVLLCMLVVALAAILAA